MPEDRDVSELSEQLFEAIDAIVKERLKRLDFDKTIVATITDVSKNIYGRYQVTTDSNIIFTAYADITTYKLNDKVYIRIPGGDYTKQKVITGRYIPENIQTTIPEDIPITVQRIIDTVNGLIKEQKEEKESGS